LKKKFVEAFNLLDVRMAKDDNGVAESTENGVTVWIEAIHALTTENSTTYTAQELRGSETKKTGQYSWNYPYDAPVLTHHNQHNGEPIGRVVAAKFSSSSQAGPPVIKLKCEITDPEAVEKVKDGRYQTVSIGGYAEHAYCSICGKDWLTEGSCNHWPGREYGEESKELAHLILGDINFIEVSFVNVPADQHAQITTIVEGIDREEVENKNENIEESINTQGGTAMTLEEQVKILEEKVKVKKEKAEVVETKLKTTESKLETLKESNELLTEEKEVLEGRVENLETEIEALVAENAELKSNQHKAMAEKVVDLKIQLGRVKEESREDKIADHVKRTAESLRDTLSDLTEEVETVEDEVEETEEVEVSEGVEVENPGLHNSVEENVEEDEGEVEESQDDDVDAEINSMLRY
jgi:hypothetical protein